MEKVIEVEDLSFAYGSQPVLNKITFVLFQGDFVGIIGSNGTGKSTLLKLLLNQLTPTAGHISVLGEDIQSFKRWPKIGYVAQNGIAAADFPATAEELLLANQFSRIGFLRFAKKEHKERARWALETVGMQDYARRLIGDLSGGQKQRIMIAKVLVNQPEILLLDEPTTGIDEKSAAALYELLTRLNRDEKITVVMVTHDVERASWYTGRVLCLEHGSVVELDNRQIREELLHKHKHP